MFSSLNITVGKLAQSVTGLNAGIKKQVHQFDLNTTLSRNSACPHKATSIAYLFHQSFRGMLLYFEHDQSCDVNNICRQLFMTDRIIGYKPQQIRMFEVSLFWNVESSRYQLR